MKKLFVILFCSAVLGTQANATSYTEALNTFEAVFNKSAVNFKWILNNPENINGVFTIEKSRDGKHFEKVSEIRSTLTGTGEIEFIDIDAKPSKKKNYYRLKFTDNTGLQSYSRVVVVEKAAKKPTLKVSVSQDAQGIEFAKFKKNEQVLLVIRDKAGNEYYSKSLILNNNNELVLDKDINLLPGEYVVVASSQNALYSSTIKIP